MICFLSKKVKVNSSFDLIKINIFPFFWLFFILEFKNSNFINDNFRFRKYQKFIDLFQFIYNKTKNEITSITESIEILN